MPTYFKPLRRKIGIVTLALACVFAAGWARSQGYDDELDFWTGPHQTHSLNSSPTGICWMKRSNLPPDVPMTTGRCGLVAFQSWHVGPGPFSDVPDPFRWSTPQWQFSAMGFHFAESTINPPDYGNLRIWIIPYWSIVIPMTLLSAWLLLSKVRKPEKQLEKAA
jgi:hypothetical protein